MLCLREILVLSTVLYFWPHYSRTGRGLKRLWPLLIGAPSPDALVPAAANPPPGKACLVERAITCPSTTLLFAWGVAWRVVGDPVRSTKLGERAKFMMLGETKFMMLGETKLMTLEETKVEEREWCSSHWGSHRCWITGERGGEVAETRSLWPSWWSWGVGAT